MVERTERRLVQVTLAIDGPAERIAALVREDFEVSVGGKGIRSFEVDVTCAVPEKEFLLKGGKTGPATPGRAASILLYFDQPHLTIQGRERAYASARALAQALLAAGHRLRVITNGRRVSRLMDWASDPSVVTAAFETLKADADQNAMDSMTDTGNIRALLRRAEDLDALERFGGCQCLPFRDLWRDLEDRHRSASKLDERSFDRLASVLWEMEGIEAPKAVVLYADTLRASAGQAYMDALYRGGTLQSLINRCSGPCSCRRDETVAAGVSGYLKDDARGRIEALVRQATARGVRIHTVEPQGLTDDHNRRAEDTLAGLALDTGGRSFLGAGSEVSRVTDALVWDASCPVILSFDADEIPAARFQDLTIKLRQRSLKVHAPGRSIAESRVELRRARWLAAAFAATDEPQEPPVFAGVVPLGREGGDYLALVQVVAPPSVAQTSRWELGAMVVDRDVVSQEVSATVSVSPASLPSVFETTIRIPRPGAALVVVGRDTATDETAAMRRSDPWPDLKVERAGLGPIALVQPARGGFVRDGQARKVGTLAVHPGSRPDPGHELAFVGLACRGRKEMHPLTLIRALTGHGSYPFDPIPLEVPEDSCAQFRDTIPAGTLGPGFYTYSAQIITDGGALTERELRFEVAQHD